jgi:hypothetical protein
MNAAATRLQWFDADELRLASSYGGMSGASWPDGMCKMKTERKAGYTQTPTGGELRNRHDKMYARRVREEPTC